MHKRLGELSRSQLLEKRGVSRFLNEVPRGLLPYRGGLLGNLGKKELEHQATHSSSVSHNSGITNTRAVSIPTILPGQTLGTQLSWTGAKLSRVFQKSLAEMLKHCVQRDSLTLPNKWQDIRAELKGTQTQSWLDATLLFTRSRVTGICSY